MLPTALGGDVTKSSADGNAGVLGALGVFVTVCAAGTSGTLGVVCARGAPLG